MILFFNEEFRQLEDAVRFCRVWSFAIMIIYLDALYVILLLLFSVSWNKFGTSDDIV